MRRMSARPYYTLRPFAELFGEGVPILMYHKIGARPRSVRLKGLYVSARAFARQLGEFKKAGYATVGPADACNNSVARRVVLTFDDGFRNVFQNALEPLARHGSTAIQFLVPTLIGKLNDWEIREGESPQPLMDYEEIRAWIEAGHAIGSHSLTHARLPRLSIRDAREEITASKKRLEDAFGLPVNDFCYPYGDWNDAVRDLVMEAGYRTACTTDFGVNTPSTPSLTLRRLMVRHPTRTLRTLPARLLGRA